MSAFTLKTSNEGASGSLRRAFVVASVGLMTTVFSPNLGSAEPDAPPQAATHLSATSNDAPDNRFNVAWEKANGPNGDIFDPNSFVKNALRVVTAVVRDGEVSPVFQSVATIGLRAENEPNSVPEFTVPLYFGRPVEVDHTGEFHVSS